MRMISETLGIGVWYLLTLPGNKIMEASSAAQLAWQLRADETVAIAETLKAENDLIEPICKDHPEMTAGEAMAELKRQTDETLRRLDESH